MFWWELSTRHLVKVAPHCLLAQWSRAVKQPHPFQFSSLKFDIQCGNERPQKRYDKLKSYTGIGCRKSYDISPTFRCYELFSDLPSNLKLEYWAS
ncbi:uncharacterized protein K444DRAFT_80131 [Hyaloscypha bicolor E]|uniref:Uncharacterized protein n=1 Tax=Hyaloscypha bicolor E TaxID=1095630 RepID=A0A2J6SYE9_9HELO|nr:uncharacterized protein K444DRAFT_80131 [Hyaloscypha bicolor E]PMD55790.1 hypothetical protein K444DRAFT_80131 [Hyaloscypha bicolor E]